MARIIDKILARRKKSQRQEAITQSISSTSSNGIEIDDLKLNGDSHTDVPQHSSGELSPGWYYSFEFFPPKTEAGLDNLLTRIDRMARRLDPLFIDVTWGAGGSTSARTLAVASYAQRYCGVEVLMHLTTVGMTREKLVYALSQAKSCGIRNILALRGDPPKGRQSWELNDVSGGDCERAIDLVKLIRKLHGDDFGIAVAGHPEGHPSSVSMDDEMKHLKEKLDAGADFIITQFFYDVDLFLAYTKKCRSCGITCPILPGIMPIQSYGSFVQMTSYCSISVPDGVMNRLESVKDDDEAVKAIGCEIASDMCRKILVTPEKEGGVDGVHFYTLNLERSVTRILMSMGAVDMVVPEGVLSSEDASLKEDPSSLSKLGTSPANASLIPHTGRTLPWRPSALEKRSREEDVRPINWANRPKSYVMRTEDWDEFPNGRWGDSSSPAFGELSDLSHFYNFSLGSADDRRAMLGHHPKTAQDVHEVFAKYVEGTIPHIPWCENPLQPESFLIQRQLAALNRAGFLTVNSQPSVNGASSTHPTFGWGGPGGYLYQKAYCEFFVSPENSMRLVAMVKENPSMNLYAVNNAGEELKVGMEEGGVTALTWGVFPNREILQPTIFDPNTFLIWAEEAFSLWTTMWQSLYEFGDESYELIETIRDSYFLVGIIDNDYIDAGNDGSNSGLWKALLACGGVDP